MYVPSVAIFGFSLAVIVFEMSIFFCKITHLGENESFFHIIDSISKIITARANPKTETEGP